MNFTNIAYNHAGIALRVSGERDEDGCEVTKVTAADSTVDLWDLIAESTLQVIASCVDAQLSKQAREAGHYARVERMVMDRAMSQLPELTVVA